jgi:transcriptional regulator with XRE-family HTH domain
MGRPTRLATKQGGAAILWMRMLIDFSSRDGRRLQGRLIGRAAEDAGLSLEGLAREIGCSRALLYQYVSGVTLAQADRLQQIALRTGKSLGYFFGLDTPPAEATERLTALQRLFRAYISPPDVPAAYATCEQVEALARQLGDWGCVGQAHLHLIRLLLRQGEAARTLALVERALAEARANGYELDWDGLAQAHGHALLLLGRIEEAEMCFTQVAASPAWHGRWQGLVSLAAVDEHRGLYRRALERLEQALLLAETAPDAHAAHRLRVYVLGNQSNIFLACGDHPQAAVTARLAEDVAVQEAISDQYIEALLTQGVCHRWSGALAASRLTLEMAGRWARLATDGAREAVAWAEQSQTLIEMGRFPEGCSLAERARAESERLGAQRAALAAYLALATGEARRGALEAAGQAAAQAWALSTHLGQPLAQAQALVALGEVAWLRGDPAGAAQAFEPAFDLAESLGARLVALQAGMGLVRVGGLAPEGMLAGARSLEAPGLLWPLLLECGGQAEARGESPVAEAYYAEAAALIAHLRQGVRDEPPGDTVLEFRLAWEPYLRAARLAQRRGDVAAAEHLIEEAAWPPLALAQEDGV